MTDTSSQTLSTTDYDLFKDVSSNREVDERHVRKLIGAIRKKNLLHINPIVCNGNFEVIDGQHRLEAARRLNVPVYYIVDDEVNKKDIASLNSNQKNWNTMDYINYWTVEKASGFDKLSSFISENQLIPPSTALMMLSASEKRDISGLKNGFVDVSNYDKACNVARVLKEMRNTIDHVYDRSFILAIYQMVNTQGYDHKIIQNKLESMPRSFQRCISKKQYLEMLEDVYNYKLSLNKLKFT